jgi:hypothetical protein
MCFNFKAVGAILLLVSLGFPMQQASHYYKDSEGAVHRQAWGTPQGATPLFDSDVYALPLTTSSPGSWENLIWALFAFSWPIIAIAYWQWRKEAIGIVPRILEIVFLAGTFLLVFWVSTFTVFTATRVGAGGYLAFLGLGFYAVGAICADAVALRRWKRRALAPVAEGKRNRSTTPAEKPYREDAGDGR